MNEIIVSKGISLNTSNLTAQGDSVIDEVVKVFDLPRDILPANSEISWAITSLPRELNMISPRLRGEFIAKACIASSVGLFDGAIIYIWNSVITELKDKVRAFGLEMIKQISGSGKPDNFLEEITDYELIKLCYQLNILNEEGHYYLQQCRDIRNNASIAHPTTIKIDDRELINFISRCCKYGLSEPSQVVGIDIKSLNVILSGSAFAVLPRLMMHDLFADLVESGDFGQIGDIAVHIVIDFDILHHFAPIRFQSAVKIVQIDAQEAPSSIIQTLPHESKAHLRWS